MTQAEKIWDDQFRDIVQADLNLCSHADDLLASYQQLKRERWVFWIISLAVILVLILLAVLALWLELDTTWLVIVAVVAAISLLILQRQNARLNRSMRSIRVPLEQTRLLGHSGKLVQFVIGMSRKVLEYNQLVERLTQLQTGDYWRDFRQLSDAEKSYIESTFVQVRGQLLTTLRICRQLLDDPKKAQVPDTLSNQLVSRDQAIIHEFTAKTMTSNQYLKLAQDLTELESSLQQQLESYRHQ